MKNESDIVKATLSSGAFKQLVKIRNTVRFILSFMLLACYMFFVGGIAFYNQWFGMPWRDGSSIPIGIIAAVVIIVTMVLLELIYIIISVKWLASLQDNAVAEVVEHG